MLILGIPAAILLVAGYVLVSASGGSDNGSNGSNSANAALSIANDAAKPTSTANAAPKATATVVAAVNRADCKAIAGTDYKSPEEQTWFKANCNGTTSTGGGGGGGTTAQSYGPASAGVQIATGGRLWIPGTSVDTDIYGAYVAMGASNLPDPTCYFCAVEYDLSAYGLSNRKVLAGHVDCATCHGGSSGVAAFWDLERGSVGPGMEIKYSSGGTVYTFVITQVGTFSPTDNVVALASNADMTLITCGGTWDPVAHEYSYRRFVFANLKA